MPLCGSLLSSVTEKLFAILIKTVLFFSASGRDPSAQTISIDREMVAMDLFSELV